MCRIAGWWNMNRGDTERGVLGRMLAQLKHGGPDGGGEYFSLTADLALGHRRLSIVDLSEAGAQPMAWRHWQIIFNGEIYNYKNIRAELEGLGYSFSTGTDTEVLLKGFEAWGMQALLGRCRGMFAFGLWDEQAQRLYLVRDRMGVKPLFLYRKDGLWVFASELKAILAHPQVDKKISTEALSLYLQLGYIPQTHCIFEYVQKVAAGHYLELHAQGSEQKAYWRAEDAYKNPMQIPDNEKDIINFVESELADSFGLRLVADVEVGAFLSGGVDSSLVVALLRRQASNLQTFTMGFADEAYNEAPQARKIAEHLGTQHHEIICDEVDFLGVLPYLPTMYDEPFGDSSGVPTYLIARLAKSRVKVSLSADGGDELFGGYTKYEAARGFVRRLGRWPSWARKSAAGILGMFSPQWLERNARFIPILGRYKNLNHKVPKLVEALRSDSLADFFRAASSYAPASQLQRLIRPEVYRAQALAMPTAAVGEGRLLGYLGLADMQTYLEGDIMTKVDRATMHNALEGREPFLDHKLVELALALPDAYKHREGKTKWILRQILYKYVPAELIDRPKQGFAVPIEKWLRGVLRDSLEALAEDDKFFARIPLQQAEIQQLIQNFLSQKQWVNPHLLWFIYALWRWDSYYLAD